MDDPLQVVRQNFASLQPPFVHNDDKNAVLDSTGEYVAVDLLPSRGRLIAAALNYTVTRQDEKIRLLCAHLLVELDRVPDPRLAVLKSTSIFEVARGPEHKWMAPPPRMLTLKEADKVIWDYMNDWDTIVESRK